jgi:hypothetical protein
MEKTGVLSSLPLPSPLPPIRDLIHFASRIQDQDVQRELLLFYLNCSPIVQEYLRSEEVLAKNHFLSQASGRK